MTASEEFSGDELEPDVPIDKEDMKSMLDID